MFGSLFNSRKSVSFSEFLANVKAGNRDFFTLLCTPEKNFDEASFEELLSNTDDVFAEVSSVQKNFRSVYFGLFDSCLIKHHDNGDVKWVFYTVTKDVKSVMGIADTLYSELGSGFFDDSIAFPFRSSDKVALIAQGLHGVVEKEIHSIWLHEDITALLQYKKDPLRQFSLMVTTKKPKAMDTSIRRRTILELIQQDLDIVLAGDPIGSENEFEDGVVKFTDFVYSGGCSDSRCF